MVPSSSLWNTNQRVSADNFCIKPCGFQLSQHQAHSQRATATPLLPHSSVFFRHSQGKNGPQPLFLPFCPDKWGNQQSASGVFKSCLVLEVSKASALLRNWRWGGGGWTRVHNLLHRFHSTPPAHIQIPLQREAGGLTLAPRAVLL